MPAKFPPVPYLKNFRSDGRFPPEVYDSCAPSYTHWNPLVRWWAWERVRCAQKLIASCRGRVAVDLGCGFGVMLPFLSERFSRVYAVDIETGPAEQVRRDFALSGVVVARRTGPCLPVAPASADLVVALDVLEHVPDLAAEITALHRVLRPGGNLLVSVPTENRLYRLGRRLAGFSYEGGQSHHRHPGAAVLAQLGLAFAEVRRKAILPVMTCSLLVLYERSAVPEVSQHGRG